MDEKAEILTAVGRSRYTTTKTPGQKNVEPRRRGENRPRGRCSRRRRTAGGPTTRRWRSPRPGTRGATSWAGCALVSQEAKKEGRGRWSCAWGGGAEQIFQSDCRLRNVWSSAKPIQSLEVKMACNMCRPVFVIYTATHPNDRCETAFLEDPHAEVTKVEKENLDIPDTFQRPGTFLPTHRGLRPHHAACDDVSPPEACRC